MGWDRFHWRDDRRFVRGLIHHAPEDMQSVILREYWRVYDEAAYAEPVAHKKDSAGRRAANTMLREDAESMWSGCKETKEKYRRLCRQQYA